MRWRPTTETAWRSNFDTAMNVELEMVATGDIQGGQIGTNATANTRDSLLGGNDGDRIFTWHWASHGTKGFSYGNDVTNGANNDTSFLWESVHAEDHAIPYTELYIRLRDPQEEFLDSIVDETVHGVVYQLDGEVAGLAVDPDGSYSFDPAVAAYQALAAGENQEVIANWTATTEDGETAAGTLTVTITGTDDPTVITVDTAGAVTEGHTVTATGSLTVSDPDEHGNRRVFFELTQSLIHI